MGNDALGIFEYQILSVLVRQSRDTYGVEIAARIAERTGREVSIGALYTALERMERKAFVASWWGEPTAKRGGRRKHYYRIEAAGLEALRRTAAIQLAVGGAPPAVRSLAMAEDGSSRRSKKGERLRRKRAVRRRREQGGDVVV